MAYSIVKCVGTEYAVDWEVVERFCLSYWKTYYQLRCSETIRMSEPSWYNPFSWKLPEIANLEVDWDAVRSSAQRACASDMFAYSRKASTSMRDIAWELKYKVEQTAVLRRRFVEQLKDIQSANLSAVDNSINEYTGLIEASRFIRDTSADVVAIGSTIATGGAAAGLLGASSAMKGLGKYQDTGKVGASILYGGGSMLLGAFKVSGAKLTSGGEYTLIIAQGVLESGTSLVAGDSFGKAMETGGLKIASSGTAQALFSTEWMKRIVTRLPVPMNVWVNKQNDGVNQMFVDEGTELFGKVGKKLTEKGTKAGLVAATRRPTPASQQGSQSGLLDDVPLEQMLLLYLSIVNMEKGIGRGW
jgi:hypothetical protein